MMAEVVIAPTGTANLASVMAAFRRLGATTAVAEGPEAIGRASHVMLPGVGAFGAAVSRLRQGRLDGALLERIAADRPTMCICVGHQLLFATSEESPGAAGLGVVDADIRHYPADVRTPQFGWNRVEAAPDAGLLDSGYAYFANSYRAVEAPGWEVAWGEHGGRFVAAMARGNVIGCQFHPELSGEFGTALLARFLRLR
jgi:imidazole glycerol phosphate synthase glutamine amidotransferase subunit